MATHYQHRVPLWGLFLALLAFTAAEVGLFETWSRIPAFHDALPKFALVLLILTFTIPKALIVMVYFMHLKFERQLIVMLAVVPFIFVSIAVLTILTDIVTLKNNGRTYNQVANLGEYKAERGHESHDVIPTREHVGAASGEEASTD